jgi:hypothetical protein
MGDGDQAGEDDRESVGRFRPAGRPVPQQLVEPGRVIIASAMHSSPRSERCDAARALVPGGRGTGCPRAGVRVSDQLELDGGGEHGHRCAVHVDVTRRRHGPSRAVVAPLLCRWCGAFVEDQLAAPDWPQPAREARCSAVEVCADTASSANG